MHVHRAWLRFWDPSPTRPVSHTPKLVSLGLNEPWTPSETGGIIAKPQHWGRVEESEESLSLQGTLDWEWRSKKSCPGLL
jgi:hypothetical protein